MATESQRQLVISVFRNGLSAENCFTALLSRGHLSSDINVVMSQQTCRHEFGCSWIEDIDLCDGHNRSSASHRIIGTDDEVPERQHHRDGGVETSVGTTLAATIAIGTSLTIPGLDLIVSGPLVSPRMSTSPNLFTNGDVEGLTSLGVPRQDAIVYDHALREGGIVIVVEGHPHDTQFTVWTMIECGGEHVCNCNYCNA